VTIDLLPYGVVGRPHGVRGELVLRPFNRPPSPAGDVLAELTLPAEVTLMRERVPRQETLASARPAQDGYLVTFAGFESREEAAALTNMELWLPRADLGELAPGEFYVADLIGCEAYDLEGRRRGVIRETFWNGAQEVITIIGDDGAELLIPAVPEFVGSVDVKGRRVVIDPHE